MNTHQTAPDAIPTLSRGRHRSPRKGACFMEMASFLAGERWSDHPSCTHPVLASLARKVNDTVSDDARRELVPLIDQVIGLTSDDPRVDARIVLRCAVAALPIAPAERQNVLAVGILTCERLLAQLDGRQPGELSARSLAALTDVPAAHAWAHEFSGTLRVSVGSFRRSAASTILETAVQGICEAVVGDTDARLVALLTDAIAEVRALTSTSHPTSDRPIALPVG